jgi:predicted small lipoprotein YifL
MLSPLACDLLWCLDRGVPEVTSLPHLRFARIAAIAALIAALGVAGCGRKGGLDPPPGATAADTSPSRADLEPAIGPDGRVMAPQQGPQRRTPIDWLLN